MGDDVITAVANKNECERGGGGILRGGVFPLYPKIRYDSPEPKNKNITCSGVPKRK